jgi:hypothetical protein
MQAKMQHLARHLSVALDANFALLVSSMHLFRACCEADHMSTFVEIDPSEYDKDAFAAFDASTGDFRIGNARALMWLSHLAYEAHREETIREVAQKWNLTSVISPGASCRRLARARSVLCFDSFRRKSGITSKTLTGKP